MTSAVDGASGGDSGRAVTWRTFKFAAIGIIVLAAVGGGGWFIVHQFATRFLVETNDAFVRAESVTISARVSGYVENVSVQENQDVVAGQPLLKIDARDYRAQADQYSAQEEVAAANAANVLATIGEQRATVDQSEARLQGAIVDKRFADEEVSRYAPLAASGAESSEKFTSLRRQAADAASQALQARAGFESAKRRIGSLEAQVRQAEAQGDAARAQRAAASVNAGSAVLRASIAGRIGNKSVQVGQFVQPGIRLMSVVPLQGIYIIANFKETQIGKIRVGQSARVLVDALPGLEITGHVASLSPGTGADFSLLPPQNATGNFTKIVQRIPVRIALDVPLETKRRLISGLSATVSVDTHGTSR
jgi:membrane fusion protein (multidrug efflux system)